MTALWHFESIWGELEFHNTYKLTLKFKIIYENNLSVDLQTKWQSDTEQGKSEPMTRHGHTENMRGRETDQSVRLVFLGWKLYAGVRFLCHSRVVFDLRPGLLGQMMEKSIMRRGTFWGNQGRQKGHLWRWWAPWVDLKGIWRPRVPLCWDIKLGILVKQQKQADAVQGKKDWYFRFIFLFIYLTFI